MNSCPFKKFKNIFGAPNTGVHKYKFLGTSIIDFLLTLVLAAVTSYFSKIPFVVTTILWLNIGIIFHVLFGVETDTLKYFGFKCERP